MKPQHDRARVISKTLSGPDTVHMVLSARWLHQAQPGQFVMLRVQAATDPLLRRPLSLCAVTPDGIELLFKIRGPGTEHMAAWPIGHTVDIIGPLGNGFPQPRPGTPIYLVAGGIGVAPLIGLARCLQDNRQAGSLCMVLGAKTAVDIHALTPFIPPQCTLHIATDNGTCGHRGLVTDTVASLLIPRADSIVYGCGPMPMLKALAALTRSAGQPCFVSLEAHMACGIGACLGCTIPTSTAHGPTQLRVCADGPVFEAERIFPAH